MKKVIVKLNGIDTAIGTIVPNDSVNFIVRKGNVVVNITKTLVCFAKKGYYQFKK